MPLHKVFIDFYILGIAQGATDERWPGGIYLFNYHAQLLLLLFAAVVVVMMMMIN